MNKQNLKRAADEIKTALDTAKGADTSIDAISAVDADVFKQIARPLRRALRLVNEKPAKSSQAEQDADVLFDIMKAGGHDAGEPAYEIGCVLDEFINAANRVYLRRDFFTMMYLDALRDKKRDYFAALAFRRIKGILRDLKRGVPAATIARQLNEGTLDKKRGKGR